MSSVTYVYPVPEGSIEVRPVSGLHAAVLIFDHGYGSTEFARGTLTTVLGEVFRVMKEGVTFGPHHEPGAPLKWFHFPHDDSYRATVHDGEFRVLRHDGVLAGVHVRRREGGAMVGLECDLPKILAVMEDCVQGNEAHVPLAIVHRGRRGNLKVSSRPGEILAYQADESTRYFVTARGIAESSALLVWRDVNGVTECLRTYTAFEEYDKDGGILWSEVEPSEHKKPARPPHRLQASHVPGDARVIERPETGPLDPGIATACEAAIRHMSTISGVGMTVLQAFGEIFRPLAANGTRVRARGWKNLKEALETAGKMKIPGGERVFRYALATCRRLGLLIFDGVLEAFAFDDIYNPATEFARHLMSQLDNALQPPTSQPPLPTSNLQPPNLQPPNLQPPNLQPPTSQPPTSQPPNLPTSQPPNLQPPPQASSHAGLWPYHDDPPDNSVCTPCIVDEIHWLAGRVRCDPAGRAGDQVNWFRHQVHTPCEFAFNGGTALGENYATKENLTGKEFIRQLLEDADRIRRESNA